MLSARASNRYHKVCLPFLCVIWNQELHHIFQLICKILCYLILHHIIEHAVIHSCLRTQFIHVIRIRKKSHIKHKICILRYPIFESKG